MEKIVTYIKNFNKYLYNTSALLVVFVVIITFMDVVGRYFFTMPVPGTFELSQLALSSMVYMTLAHTQAQKGHIALDFSIPFPPKVGKVVDILLYLISLLLMASFTWQSVSFILYSYDCGEWSDYHRLPIFIFKAFMFIGGFTFCTQIIIDIINLCNNSILRDNGGNNVE